VKGFAFTLHPRPGRENDMKTRYFVLAGLAIMTFLAGCSAGLSRLEVDYGTSYALAKQNQILDHEAGERPAPVYGLSGQAAWEMVENYQKGFGSQTAAPAKALNFSTGK